ncbi:MAG: phospholipid carrier-dependent glycosyltransferase [Elusimicrobia bacterium]|nr:phospholipid carrier-dependent glycosyltransferase [Elusimicrobiota bacterium]
MRGGALAAAAAGLLLALASFYSTALGPCAEALGALAKLAVVALIATGCGRAALGSLRLSDVSDSQKTLIGATVGLGLLSLCTFGLAALHVLSVWSLAVMLAGLWLAGFSELRAVVVSLGANRNLLVERPWAAAGVLSALALALIPAGAPPHHYDALVYHLPLAQAYARAGSLAANPRLLYSHFPQNGEMLFTLALLMKSDLLAQMFMWLCLVLSVWWLLELGKREAPLSAVLLGCLLLCTHTSVMLLSGTAYVESLVMLWTTASVLCFLRWRQVDAATPGQRSWLELCAVFSGLALGAKYTAGATAALLSAALAARLAGAQPRERGSRWADLGLYALITTAVFAPWLVKNALSVGNPVFPFLYRLFPATDTGWTAETAARYFQVLTEYGHRGTWAQDLWTLPARLLTNDPRFGGGMDALGRLGWELVFASLPLSVWALRQNRFWRGLLLFSGTYLVVWFFTGVVLRFLTAIAPLLCLLAGCGLWRLWSELEAGGRWILGTALALLTATHLFLFLYVQAVFGVGGVIIGAESRPDFLSRRFDYYPCARYADENLDKNVKLLIVGEQRGYYVDRDHEASTVNAPNRYIAWANEAKDPAELAARMKSEGFTHLLFVPREWARLGAGLGLLSKRGLSNFTGLEPGRLAGVYRGPACALYSIP